MRSEGARVGCAAPGRASGVVYAAKRPLRAAARSSGSPASRAMTVCETDPTALEDGVSDRERPSGAGQRGPGGSSAAGRAGSPPDA